MKKLSAVLAIAVSVAAQAANVPTSLVGEYHGAVNFYDDKVDTSWYVENEHTGWLPLTVKMAKDGKASGQFTMDDGLQVRFSGNAELLPAGVGIWVMQLSTNVKIYDSIIPFEFRFFDNGETQKCVVSASGKEVDEEDDEEDFLTFSGTAYKYEANAEKVRPYVGTYTLYFDTQGLYTREEHQDWQTECTSGRSVFTVKIDAKGNATVSAELCDGSKTSGNAKFVSNGEFTGVETGLYTSKFRSYDLGGNATKTTNWQGGIGLRFAIGFNDSGKVIVEDAQSFAFDYDFKNDSGFVDYAFEFNHATMALLNSDAASFSVKLDAAGGKVSPALADIVDGKLFGSLPMPTRKGYVFAGWWTAKAGGTHITDGMTLESSDFAGQKTPTLYAHWLQLRKLTMKDESAYAEWYLDEKDFDPELYAEIRSGLSAMNPDFEDGVYLEGQGVLEVLPGARVSVSITEYTEDKNWNELIFQKWTVSTKGNLGPDFRVTQNETELTMPDADVTLQGTYIDESTCGTLIAEAYALDVQFGWDEEAGTQYTIEPPYEAFEWSPDGGKTWYKAKSFGSTGGEAALLKAGAYTVTWRSADPNWRAPSSKTKTTVAAGEENNLEGAFTFTYIPQIVVDVMELKNGELRESSVAGTVTVNPKDGFAPVGKTIVLTAKAAKGYAFQGWTLASDWTCDDGFWESSATWKFENSECSSSQWYFSLNPYIDPVDKKVHVKAIFKAFTAYSADDIVFNGIGSYGFGGYYDYYSEALDNGSGSSAVTIKAMVGCPLDNLKIDCGLAASPLVYKLNGKLPNGVKFDAKTGIFSGVPKKPGDTTVTITATDPAKNARDLTINFSVKPLPSWLVGEYRGMLDEGYYEEGECEGNCCTIGEFVPGQQNGILELSVKSDGKVSAKVGTCLGTTSLSGTLTWYPDDELADEPDGTFSFWAYKGDSSCDIDFNSDGTIYGHAYTYQKPNMIEGRISGMRQDTTLLADSTFLGKYYTFAFSAETTRYSGYHNDEGQYQLEEVKMQSGYGYLTIKTDAKGGAKVTGQLPDGEKVSMSALVMPFITNDLLAARLHVFASPSSYKKHDWFAMSLVIAPDGTVKSEECAAWTPADLEGGYDEIIVDPDGQDAEVLGAGALYSEAKSLENYYWAVSCEWNENVRQQYSWKEDGETYYGNASAYAQYFDDCGFLFNVAVKGDAKGAISLVEKSAAPWEQTFKEDGQTWKEWNYETDKKGNEITDPSQLSISFTKATGIFTGKANAYFDYWQPNYKKDRDGDYHDAGSDKHVTASLPYSGVMIYNGEGGYEGYGSAVHTYKYSYGGNYGGKAKTDTKKVTLPVSLMPVNVEP